MAQFIGIVYRSGRKLAKFRSACIEFMLGQDSLVDRIVNLEREGLDISEEHKALEALKRS